MTKVILCVGISASGKSTWAKTLCANDSSFVEINKDEIRLAAGITPGNWTKQKEKDIVVPTRDRLIAEALSTGKNVISSDTNIQSINIKRIDEIARSFGAEVEIKEFPIDVEEAIRRDSLRTGNAHVGEEVIRRMAKQYAGSTSTVETYIPDVSKPKAVLVDLDGTIALFCKERDCRCTLNHRSPYAADTSDVDTINPAVAYTIERLSLDTGIIYVSGRESTFRPQTEKFLERVGVPYLSLFMRKAGDFRKDSVIKAEIFDTHIRHNYNVLFVIDDRLSVCRMWWSLGISIFRVGDPDSDF